MTDLREENEKLKERVQHLEETLESIQNERKETTKMIIQRDMELRKANEELQRLDQLKSEFVSVAAHQMRTPLSSIKWILSIIRNEEAGPLTADQSDLIEKCYVSNERVITLINDLLDIDRIESNKTDFVFENVKVDELIDVILYEANPQVSKKGLNVKLQKSTDVPVISADKGKLSIAFQNLIENALRYTPEGGDVLVKIERKGDTLEVLVRDSGIGIPKEDQKKVFTRFFRAQNARKSVANGSGLGLYLTRQIVKKHKGKIWFESEAGNGTDFYVTLPVSDEHNTATEENGNKS